MNKREDKKEAILLAGMAVMKCCGYNGTSVKDIVDAADVPKGSFYNYFESKEQFALDAIEYAADESRVHVQALLGDSSIDALERLHRFFRGGVDCACNNEFKVGCFLGNLCQEMADTSCSIQERLDAALNITSRALATVIAEGQKQGVVAKDLEVAVAAEFLFNAWEGALMRAKAARSRAPLDAFLIMSTRLLT